MNEPDGKQGADAAWSDFEHRLSERPLGPGPQRPGALLYQCGYAAGASAMQNQMRRKISRWRVVGLAASLLAGVSLSTHLISTSQQNASQIGAKQPPTAPPALEQKHNSPAAPDPWIGQLTRRSSGATPDRQPLRASDMTLSSAAIDDSQEGIPTVVPGDHGGPLRPRDSELFL